MTASVTPAIKAAAGDPRRVLEHFNSPLWRMILPFVHAFWLRPEQVIPESGWKYLTLRGGRGWGKTFAIAVYITRQIMNGSARHIALMATNEDRTKEIQIKALIEAAPPWFKPVESKGGLTWPNGVRAEVFTPEAPDAIRSENVSIAWLCEVLAWPAAPQPNGMTKRMLAFQNITTATRKANGRTIIDTTAKGRNDVISLLNKLNKEDPRLFPIIRGSMVDNPVFDRDYLRAEFLKYVEGSRRFQEEVEGKDFDDALGALWTQELIEGTRRLVAPDQFDLVLLGMDPAYSDRADADETGLILAGRKGQQSFFVRDLSARMDPDVWAERAVTTAIEARASGAVIEVNSTARMIPTIMKSACKTHGLVMIELERGKPFPAYRPGVFYVRLVVSREDKYERAKGPAAEMLANRLHVVGEMPELEEQLTTYEPQSGGKSPGRYDAGVHVANELAGLTTVAAEDNAPGVLGAAIATATLNQALAAANAGRRVGM